MDNANITAARLPVLAVELTRCCEELLACIESDDLEPFDRLLDQRSRLLDELRAAIATISAPVSEWRTLFADVLESEARLKTRVEAEHRRLAQELGQVGETRANLGRLADAYMELDA